MVRVIMETQITLKNRKMKILRNNKKKLEIKKTEMKSAFDEFINRLDMTEKRISELEDMIIGTSKPEKQREKKNLLIGKIKTKQNSHILEDN